MSLAERRAYKRYKCALPVYLQPADNDAYALRTVEISMGGLRIECDSLVMRALLPDGLKTIPGDRVLMRARLFLAEQEDPAHLLEVQLHAVGATRLAENCFAVHFAFVDPTPQQLQLLSEFTEQIGV